MCVVLVFDDGVGSSEKFLAVDGSKLVEKKLVGSTWSVPFWVSARIGFLHPLAIRNITEISPIKPRCFPVIFFFIGVRVLRSEDGDVGE